MINFNKIIFIYEFTNSTKWIIAVIGKKIIIIKFKIINKDIIQITRSRIK